MNSYYRYKSKPYSRHRYGADDSSKSPRDLEEFLSEHPSTLEASSPSSDVSLLHKVIHILNKKVKEALDKVTDLYDQYVKYDIASIDSPESREILKEMRFYRENFQQLQNLLDEIKNNELEDPTIPEEMKRDFEENQSRIDELLPLLEEITKKD